MRAVKIMLFSVLGATIVAVVALIIASNLERGPAHTFRLVPIGSATNEQLVSDAAALVRRLQSLGYSDTQSQVVGDSISLTLYGSGPQVNDALKGTIAEARFEVRPVECATPLFAPGPPGVIKRGSPPGTAPTATCRARYLLSASSLQVNPDTGIPKNSVGPDPSFIATPNTPGASDVQSEIAIFPAGPASGFSGERLFLGPVQLGNDAIASAGTSKTANDWIVEITFTTATAKKLDLVAKKQFHAYIAICVDGTVVSAPIVEPISASFSSLGGKLQLSAGLTKSEALDLADDLTSPLSVPLKVASSG